MCVCATSVWMELEKGFDSSETKAGCSISILDCIKVPAWSDLGRKRLIEKPKHNEKLDPQKIMPLYVYMLPYVTAYN